VRFEEEHVELIVKVLQIIMVRLRSRHGVELNVKVVCASVLQYLPAAKKQQ